MMRSDPFFMLPPTREDILFRYETPEERENRLREAEARRVERRKREIEAKKKRREEFHKRVQDRLDKIREERRMGIETRYWEQEHPRKAWERKLKERSEHLTAQGHEPIPPIIGLNPPPVERIHPGPEVEKMIGKTSAICFED